MRPTRPHPSATRAASICTKLRESPNNPVAVLQNKMAMDSQRTRPLRSLQGGRAARRLGAKKIAKPPPIMISQLRVREAHVRLNGRQKDGHRSCALPVVRNIRKKQQEHQYAAYEEGGRRTHAVSVSECEIQIDEIRRDALELGIGTWRIATGGAYPPRSIR